MEDRRKHIDDLFREGLGDYRENPPASVWTSLEQRLPASEEPNRRWLWYLLLLLLLGTAGYLVYKTSLGKSSKEKKYNQNIEKARHPSSSITSNTELRGLSENILNEKDEQNKNDVNDLDNLRETQDHHAALNKRNASSTTKNTIDKNVLHSTKKTKTADGALVASKYNSNLKKEASEKKRSARTDNAAVNKNNTAQESATTSLSSHNDQKKLPAKKDAVENRNAGNTVRKEVSATTISNNKVNDNSYLLQLIPEDDEDDVNDTGEDDEITKPIARKNAKEEDEQARKLLYIPQEAFPKIDLEEINNETNKEDKSISQNKFRNKAFNETDETFSKKDVDVTSADNSKKPHDSKPENFKKKALKEEKASQFNNSKLIVDSEVPTDPNEKIVVNTANNAASNDVNASSNKTAFSASGNATLFKEENNNSQASAGGGGAGGGGGASPAKNGSKFRFDLGIKAGYERGFADFTTNTFIISPYLQWNISTGFAFVFQPGFRYNQLNKNDISASTQAYHNITNYKVTENHVYSNDTFGTYIQRNYTYTNIYDSIVIGSALKTKNFWEVELPIMLRVKIASNFAVFGGLSLIFGNIIQMEQSRTDYTGLQKTATLSFGKAGTNTPPPAIPPPDQYFSYNTLNIAQVSDLNVNPPTNPARLGLMFGFSYDLQKRITLDVLYKQTVSDMKYIPNEQVRKIYTQPYFRVMFGFKLFEGGKQENTIKNPADL